MSDYGFYLSLILVFFYRVLDLRSDETLLACEAVYEVGYKHRLRTFLALSSLNKGHLHLSIAFIHTAGWP